MIRTGRLHHASVRTADLERSRKFYEEVLGLRAIERPDMGFPGAWYGLGDAQLHLIALPKYGDGIDPTDPHFAIEVADFGETRRTVAAAGLPFVEIGDVLWVKDPDGMTIELRQKE